MFLLLAQLLGNASSMYMRDLTFLLISSVWIFRVLLSALRFAFFGFGGPDAKLYQDQAVALSKTEAVRITGGKEGWPELLSYIYVLSGAWPYMGIMVATTLGVLAAWLISRCVHEIGHPEGARAAFLIAAIAPQFVFWGDTLLREAACWFGIALGSLGLLRLSARVLFSGLLLTLGGLVVLFQVRATLMVVFVVGYAFAAVIRFLGKGPAGAVVGSVSMISLLFVTPVLLASLSASSLYGYDVDQINVSRNSLARDSSTSFGQVGTIGSYSDVPQVLLNSLPRALLGPFPWEWGTAYGQLLAAVDGMTWWVILGVIVLGRKSVSRAMFVRFAVPALFLLMSLAVTSGNYGSMIRVRAIAMLMIVPIIVVAWKSIRSENQSTSELTSPIGLSGPDRAR